jgi:hypothetical protein
VVGVVATGVVVGEVVGVTGGSLTVVTGWGTVAVELVVFVVVGGRVGAGGGWLGFAAGWVGAGCVAAGPGADGCVATDCVGDGPAVDGRVAAGGSVVAVDARPVGVDVDAASPVSATATGLDPDPDSTGAVIPGAALGDGSFESIATANPAMAMATTMAATAALTAVVWVRAIAAVARWEATVLIPASRRRA